MSIRKYEDIINLPHHVSKKHPQMSLDARSAQFAPYSALTGYDDEIKETTRFTNKRKEIDEELKEILNLKLQKIQEIILQKPEITFTYFVPDAKKDGGSYVTIKGKVLKIDNFKQIIILENRGIVPIKEIIEIEGVIEKYN